jgi:[acyl-carrier-protein] S-malonyltransferase
MLAQGVDNFIEIGPGKVLSGMVKRINKQVRVFNVEDSASLNETLAALAFCVSQ